MSLTHRRDFLAHEAQDIIDVDASDHLDRPTQLAGPSNAATSARRSHRNQTVDYGSEEEYRSKRRLPRSKILLQVSHR